jgi:hypothetical protein
MTFIPLFADAEQQAAARYAGEIAAEYGVDYLNFFDLDAVNYHVDFADTAGHLNTAGARKITQYIGDYIAERYGIPDHRGETAYENWERDHARYTEKKNEALRAQEDLYHYLMLLTRDAADAVLLVNDSSLFHDPIAAELLAGLGAGTGELSEKTKLILIRNGGESAAALTELPAARETVSTPAGTVTGGEPLLLNGVPVAAEGTNDLRITVLRDGGEIDSVGFDYVLDPDSGRITLQNTSRSGDS